MPRDADSLQVDSLLSAADPDWDRFVESRPEATFFHLSGWKAVIEESFGHRCHYLAARRGGEIVGVLPLTHVRGRIFGNSLISNGFCVYGGPLSASADALGALDGAALELARDLGVERIEYRLRAPLHPDWPCNRQTYVTFRREIDPDPEKAMLAIPRKQRAMVRKGIKEGLVGESDADVSRLYPLYAESLLDLNPWHTWTKDGQPMENTAEVVAVLERTLERTPTHVLASLRGRAAGLRFRPQQGRHRLLCL